MVLRVRTCHFRFSRNGPKRTRTPNAEEGIQDSSPAGGSARPQLGPKHTPRESGDWCNHWCTPRLGAPFSLETGSSARRFLNRVRKFDSCRGHLHVEQKNASCAGASPDSSLLAVSARSARNRSLLALTRRATGAQATRFTRPCHQGSAVSEPAEGPIEPRWKSWPGVRLLAACRAGGLRGRSELAWGQGRAWPRRCADWRLGVCHDVLARRRGRCLPGLPGETGCDSPGLRVALMTVALHSPRL